MQNDRLEMIETKLTFAEDLLEELNRLVFRQQEQINRLQAQVLRLAEKPDGTVASFERDPRDDIPPHY